MPVPTDINNKDDDKSLRDYLIEQESRVDEQQTLIDDLKRRVEELEQQQGTN